MSSNLISVSKSQGLVLDMIRRQPGTTRTRLQNQLGLPQQSLSVPQLSGKSRRNEAFLNMFALRRGRCLRFK